MRENLELLEKRLAERLKGLESDSSEANAEKDSRELRRTKQLLKRVSAALETTQEEFEEGS